MRGGKWDVWDVLEMSGRSARRNESMALTMRPYVTGHSRSPSGPYLRI